MKKIVSTFALALLVGGLTFAEDPAVKIGAWGRGLFIPVITGNQVGGEDVTASALGVSWGGSPRVGFTVAGSSDFVGFQADVNADNNEISVGDQQKIWIKPMEGVLIQLGEAYDDTLRGNGTFGSFDWVRIGAGGVGEDFTFNRLDTGKGFEVSYTNGDFFVFAAARNLAGAKAVDLNKSLLKSTQEGFGYTIKDIGQIRVQAIGHAEVAATAGSVVDTTFEDADGDGVDDTFDAVTTDPTAAVDAYQQIQAAFKLTSVQNLYVDVGVDFPSVKDAAGYTAKLAAYANYTADKAKLHLLVGYVVPASGSDAPIVGGVGLDYALEDGLGFSADVRYQNKFAAGNDDGLTNVFGGITKGFSNGLIGVGLQYATHIPAKTFGLTGDKAGLLIPVRAEYWF
jgi:hypothetical protein